MVTARSKFRPCSWLQELSGLPRPAGQAGRIIRQCNRRLSLYLILYDRSSRGKEERWG